MLARRRINSQLSVQFFGASEATIGMLLAQRFFGADR
jgi:hypothetical protein